MATKNNTTKPQVSVIMPMYNCGATVGAAVDSILAQTLESFELILIDDSSSDQTLEVIKGYDDSRIRLLRNDTNLGVAETLNRGLSECRGTYVARMDSDDLSFPARLAKQVSFLDSKPSVSICGTFAELFGEKKGQIKPPAEVALVRCKLLFDTCFVHPTVMFRNQDFQRLGLRYNNLKHFEDLELWQRAIGPLNGANIAEVLLKYRVTGTGAHRSGNPDEQREQYRALDMRTLIALGITPGTSELKWHHAVRRIVEEPFDLGEIENWLLRLTAANHKSHVYPEDALRRSLGRLWFLACHHAPGIGLVKRSRLTNSSLFDGSCASVEEHARFLARYRPRARPIL